MKPFSYLFFYFICGNRASGNGPGNFFLVGASRVSPVNFGRGKRQQAPEGCFVGPPTLVVFHLLERNSGLFVSGAFFVFFFYTHQDFPAMRLHSGIWFANYNVPQGGKSSARACTCFSGRGEYGRVAMGGPTSGGFVCWGSHFLAESFCNNGGSSGRVQGDTAIKPIVEVVWNSAFAPHPKGTLNNVPDVSSYE